MRKPTKATPQLPKCSNAARVLLFFFSLSPTDAERMQMNNTLQHKIFFSFQNSIWKIPPLQVVMATSWNLFRKVELLLPAIRFAAGVGDARRSVLARIRGARNESWNTSNRKNYNDNHQSTAQLSRQSKLIFTRKSNNSKSKSSWNLNFK